MRLTLPEPTIQIGSDDFSSEKDWLDRKAFGERLTNLVDGLDNPTVIALDGAWGSGKSHFLRLWAGAHKTQFNGKAQIVYFDAFKEDFLDDPLVSLVAALAPAQEPEGKLGKAATKLKRLALPLAKGGARIGLAVATAGVTAALEGVWDSLAEAASGEAGKAVEAVDKLWARETTKRAAMDAFVETLREATQPDAEGEGLNKLVIIVDELDRCRPDYALSLLETIKHFFAVDGVHFVLGVNLSELENSVKARYGAGCNARNYLQKFVTITATLPDVRDHLGRALTSYRYAERLAKAYDFSKDLCEIFPLWIEARDLKLRVSLRDIDRCARRLALVAATLASKESAFLHAATALSIVDALDPAVSGKLRRLELASAPLSSFFGADAEDRGSAWRHKVLAALERPADYSSSHDGSWELEDYSITMLRYLYENHIDAWQLSS